MHVRAEVVRHVGVKSVRSRVRVFPYSDSVCLLAHSKIHILQSYFMTIYISGRRRFVRRYDSACGASIQSTYNPEMAVSTVRQRSTVSLFFFSFIFFHVSCCFFFLIRSPSDLFIREYDDEYEEERITARPIAICVSPVCSAQRSNLEDPYEDKEDSARRKRRQEERRKLVRTHTTTTTTTMRTER